MIRLFSSLCKTLSDCVIDLELFRQASDGFFQYNVGCPNCGAVGKLSAYGDYSRWLVFLNDRQIVSQRVRPLRFQCKSCKSTHALLPDILTPYSSYSLRFKLSALIAYFTRDTTVAVLCERLGIAVSTLYAWKAWILTQKDLMLGVLASRKEPALAFLHGLLGSACLSARLNTFFSKYGFSFMQSRTLTTLSLPP